MVKDGRHDQSHSPGMTRDELARRFPGSFGACAGVSALSGVSGSACTPSAPPEFKSGRLSDESDAADALTTGDIGGNEAGGDGGGCGDGRGGGAFRQSGPRHPSVHSQCPLLQLPSRVNNQAVTADTIGNQDHRQHSIASTLVCHNALQQQTRGNRLQATKVERNACKRRTVLSAVLLCWV